MIGLKPQSGQDGGEIDDVTLGNAAGSPPPNIPCRPHTPYHSPPCLRVADAHRIGIFAGPFVNCRLYYSYQKVLNIFTIKKYNTTETNIDLN